MDNNALFRADAIAARRDDWLGTVDLRTAHIGWLLTGMAVLGLSALTWIVCFGSYTRHVRVEGQLINPQIPVPVMSDSAGTVTRIWFSTGQHVISGQPLLELQVPPSDSQGPTSIQIVRAPMDGEIVDGLITQDGHLANGQNLLWLLPNPASLQAILSIPDEALAATTKGNVVDLYLDQPGRAADTAIQARVISIDEPVETSGVMSHRIHVAINSSTWPQLGARLTSGSSVYAILKLEHRHLHDMLLNPS